ncbi:hypothetical protein Tco_1111052 [Tanacetum coccineum]|uniref:Reverse transcriptase domain-containing protein n=1 Tax=Tanacetum coccineum TaxID=301880 RepID=A0ABQ5IKI0_9ASTR
MVAPTPNSVIVRLVVDENFVINSTHLKMIWENKFDGILRADPHDHIREFLAICDMFKYGETQSEAVKLLIFPFSLCDKAKTWFNELNEVSFSQSVCESLIEAWLRLKNMLQKCHRRGLTKGAIIHIFYLCLDEPSQGILDGTSRGIFLYKSPNEAFQLLEEKVLFKLDWSTKSQNEHHQKSVAFADGSNSDNDNSRLMEKLDALTIKMDSQFQSLKEEIHEMRKNYYNREDNHASKNSMNDDTPMCEHHEANYIQSEDEWDKSQNVSSEQTDRTKPPPPPQAHTEKVNAVFTGSEKSDDPPKVQKDPPPPIIVNNKIEKDRPTKTSKRGYYVVKSKEYSFREYIPKIPYPQHFKVDHSHLNRIIKES